MNSIVKHMVTAVSVIGWLLLSNFCLGQSQKLQVVTKTVTHNFDFTPGDRLILNGEKSDISVTGWDKNEVSVTVKLISKALDREVAKKELPNLRYIAEKNGNELNLKNYFLLPPGQKKFEAILTVSFEVMVPKNMRVDITSKYGNVSLSYLVGHHEVSIRYGELKIKDVETTGRFKCYFGDLLIDKIRGNSKFDLRHVKASIIQLEGGLELTSNLGDISLVDPGKIKSLSIIGTKSDIEISGISTEAYNFDLKAEYGKIFLPENSKDNSYLKDWKHGSTSLPLFFLKTKFGNIKITEK